MSKTITIPGAAGCRITVVLNGTKYIYTAGETATVPDEVAALLEDNEGNAVIYGRSASAPLAPALIQYDGNDFVPVYADSNGRMLIRKSDLAEIINAAIAEIPAELPAVSDTDEGKVLTVSAEGVWVAAALPE